MPPKTPHASKQPKSAKHDLGYAKQRDLLVLKKDLSTLGADVGQFKKENEKQHKQINDNIDFLAIKAVENDEVHGQIIKRLDKIETVVEKTYNMLDTHMKTQIRFDHELAATSGILDRHEARIGVLERRP